MDRTTWEFGSHSHNILTIGIVYEGVAIPILWWMLKKKKGNSSSDERMRFIEEMLRIFPSAEIRCLCGDRKFIGQAWIRYLLLDPMLAFCLRIRATDKIERNGKTLAAKVVFAHLTIGESQRLQGHCRVWGYPVSVEALRLPDNSLLIVIGHPDSTYGALDYRSKEFMIKGYDTANTKSTIEFLKYLQEKRKGQKIAVIWDGASYHGSDEFKGYLSQVNQDLEAEDWQITCLKFAPNAPEQDPVEDIWLQTKNFVRKFRPLCHSFKSIKWLFQFFADGQVFEFPKIHEYGLFIQPV